MVGASFGGRKAIATLLAGLPSRFPLPLAIVQHRGRGSGDSLLPLFRTQSALPVSEVQDKAPILGSHVYLAPPDYHLLVDREHFALSTEAPVSYSRPSIEVLFDSASASFEAGVIGVVLTCASRDGVRGAVKIKERGGILIVQDPDTAESDVLPRAVLEATNVDYVLPLAEISAELVRLCGQNGNLG